MINLPSCMLVTYLFFVILLIKPVLIINIFRKLKGLPKTYPALYHDEKYMIKSHGKWIKVGKDLYTGYFDVYKCEDCETLINVSAYAHFVSKSSIHKKCNEMVMENVME